MSHTGTCFICSAAGGIVYEAVYMVQAVPEERVYMVTMDFSPWLIKVFELGVYPWSFLSCRRYR